MKIELRKLHHLPRASEETQCFTVDIYIDGKKAGSARNAGHGGSTNIEPHALVEKLNAYGATLPRVVSKDIPDEKDPTGFFTYQPDAENIIDDLVEDELLAKTIKRVLARRILFTRPGMKGIFQTAVMKPEMLSQTLAKPDLVTKLRAEKILNLLPMDEVIALWEANATSPKV